MIEIEFMGSGGQGVVVAAKLLADAAAKSGYMSQSFASYGALRRGGQVESFVRISDSQILAHSKMYGADYLVVADESFVKKSKPALGLKNGGVLIINSSEAPEAFSSLGDFKIVTIDASSIARSQGVLLPNGLPVINTTILGAVVGMISIVNFDHLAEAIREGKIPVPEKNIEAAREAYQEMTGEARVAIAKRADEEEYLAKPLERHPVYNRDKMPRCNKCMICYIFCPSLAISCKMNPFSLEVNYELCERCGICIEECPRKAISWGVSD
jgi:pyruvate ferredoxin oxidoreductase gamma subunit